MGPTYPHHSTFPLTGATTAAYSRAMGEYFEQDGAGYMYGGGYGGWNGDGKGDGHGRGSGYCHGYGYGSGAGEGDWGEDGGGIGQ